MTSSRMSRVRVAAASVLLLAALNAAAAKAPAAGKSLHIVLV